MIYTVTLNPSIDYVVYMDGYEEGKVNRAVKEAYRAGGKGINVSVVLKNLGVDNVALGFQGGFTGKEILRLLQEQGVVTDFIEVEDGISRINLILMNKKETEINCQGPIITTQQIGVLYDKISKLQSDLEDLLDLLIIMLQKNNSARCPHSLIRNHHLVWLTLLKL